MLKNPHAGFGSSAANAELHRASLTKQAHAQKSAIVQVTELLIEAIEERGFLLSGPTDWRAAEAGEPKWVCKARGVIAEIGGGRL